MAQITVAAGRCWRYLQYIGRSNAMGAGFSQPITAAVAPSGAIYVGSRGATPWGWNKYVRITKTNSDHDFIGDFGRGGEGSGEFVWLTSVALDADENVYAADEWLNRITVFDSEGKLLKTWGEPPHDVERLNWDPAEPASAQKISLRDEAPSYQEGKLNGPSGLAFDLEGNLLVVNSLDSRIQKFTKDGEYISSFGVKGDGPGELDMPWGITVDNNGDIYIADWNNHRVQKFSPDGEHLLTFGSEKRTGVSPDGSTPYEHVLSARVPVNPNDLNHPTDVAVDGDGDVYVADWMNNRVVIFDADTKPISVIRGDAHGLGPWAERTVSVNPDVASARLRAKNPETERYLRMPTSCVFDQAANRLIIVDTWRNRIQIYEKDRSYKDPQYNI